MSSASEEYTTLAIQLCLTAALHRQYKYNYACYENIVLDLLTYLLTYFYLHYNKVCIHRFISILHKARSKIIHNHHFN
jgi:hypothetical protein